MNAGELTATLNGHTLLQYDTDGAAYHLSTILWIPSIEIIVLQN